MRNAPVTVYPHGTRRRVHAWVRFGKHPIWVDAKVVRSTPSAVGVEFRVEGQTFTAWIWGNAVTLADD